MMTFSASRMSGERRPIPKISTPQLEWVTEEAMSDDSAGTLSRSPVDLHFVAETGVARPEGPFRDLIPSKARKKARHREQSAKHVHIKPSTQRGDKSKDGISQRWELASNTNNVIIGRPILSRGPETSAPDPFYSLPISDQGHPQIYVHHYLNLFQHTYPHATPEQRRKKETVLRMAIDEPAFLHATLFHSVLNLCVLRGESSCQDLFYHHGEAIRLVNERIGAVAKKNEIATNAIIVAVGCLTHFRILSRLGSPIEGHMNGLQALVESRGGLQAIADDPGGKHVWWFVAWTDICAAICLNTPLRFPLITQEDESLLKPLPPYNALTERIKADLIKFTSLRAISLELINIYWGFRSLVPVSPNEAATLISKGQISIVLEYKTRLEKLERRALLLEHSKDLVPLESHLLIFKLFGSAALIHVMLFLRDSPCSAALSHTLSTRIKTILQTGNTQALQRAFPEMMVWIVMMAGIGGIGTHNQKFFAKCIAVMCLKSGQPGVKEFMWFDIYLGICAMPFWNEVAVAQGTDDRVQTEMQTGDRTRQGNVRLIS